MNFIKLIRKYYEDPRYVESDEFREIVESSIEYKPKDQEDLILMSFYAWLKSKMENKELYNTTLDLVTG